MSQPTCPRCRRTLNAVAAFCPNCGYELSQRQVAPPPPLPPATRSGWPIAFIVIGGGVLLILGAALFTARAVVEPASISPAQMTSPPLSVPQVTMPAMPVPFQSPGLSIKDSSGHEITDPALREKIKEAIEKNQR